MIYVKRINGVITARFANSQDDAQEYVDENSPELLPTVAELKAAKQAQIDALEAKAWMRRGQRETWLLNVTEKYTAAGYTHAQVYATNPEYKRVYDENVLATQYRAELKAIV